MTTHQLYKGAGLEVRTAAYFQSLGYWVRRGVKLSVAAGTSDATDIDLLAVRFSTPLSEERLIADCKDRQKAKPFERILWSKGLATFANAHRAVVVSPRVPWQAREFAAFGGIEIIETELLDLTLHSAPELSPFGDADMSLAQEYDGCAREGTPVVKGICREANRLRQMIAVGHPITNFNRIVGLIEELSRMRRGLPERAQWLIRYVALDALAIASVMLLRFAAEVKWTPEKDWSEYARKRLTYGDIPPTKAKELASLAMQSEFWGGLPQPEYTEEVVHVIEAFISRPALAVQVPNAIDRQLFGRHLRGIKANTLHGQAGDQEELSHLCKHAMSAVIFASNSEDWLAQIAIDGR